ncbi:tyrosine-protein kinase RYK isoform X1 [Hyalella azteca]|uniref:Tyrosine-protein kinase RYK isoform X1 n=2 Tax=Hyalella azteca TaxID=294128 RepID=A0A979FNF2_HYAAZ|nr:tyrosine-protein kinase RYK isoform X1 [Hyalella azteca]
MMADIASLLSCLLAFLFPIHGAANLNLYLKREEVKGLLGLDSELYYVRAGVINTYALGYTVKVPSNTTGLHFTWSSQAKRPMPYEAAVEYDKSEAMFQPRLNISAKGFVPSEPSTFRLTLPCSGRADAEVLVALHLNVSDRHHNLTSVTFRRKKICLKAKPEIKDPDADERKESVLVSPQFAHASLGTVYVAMGCAATVTVLVITLTAIVYLRVKRSRDSSSTITSRFYSSPSYFGSGRPPASLRSNSYATIASCKHLTTNTKTVLVENRNPLGYDLSFSCVGNIENGVKDPHKNDIQETPEKFKDLATSSSVLGCGNNGSTDNNLSKNVINLSSRSCVSETRPFTNTSSSLFGIDKNRTCTSSSVAGVRDGMKSSAENSQRAPPKLMEIAGFSSKNINKGAASGICTTLIAAREEARANSRGGSTGGSNSLHYASSPLSQVYSTPYNASPAHSWHPNSRISIASSWGATLRSQFSWRESRRKDTKETIKSLEVDRWRVVVGDMTHGGTFGRVHEGLCRHPNSGVSQPVIVKTVSGAASASQAKLVLHEGLLMAGLQHPNLLPIMGVCTASPHAPLLLYPLHAGSHNLKQYLMKSASGGAGVAKLLTHDAVGLAIGVCKGLLHLHHSGILHKDVATRNCTIDSEMCVRVCDTALSRDLFPGDYHCLGDNENRPVKWLPLETLQHNSFSAAADVWMFGVLVWELITLAQAPYVEVDPYEMLAYLRDGYRLAQPRSCPDDLFGVMAVCWAPQPDDRPSLQELLACLEAFHNTLTAFI